MLRTIFWAALGGAAIDGMLHCVLTHDAASAAFNGVMGSFALFYAAPHWYKKSTENNDA